MEGCDSPCGCRLRIVTRWSLFAGELRSQLYIARKQGYIVERQFDELYQLTLGISRKITRFAEYLRSDAKSPRAP